MAEARVSPGCQAPSLPSPQSTVLYSFVARYEGTQCVGCDLPILVGQTAQILTYSGVTVHQGCE